ncbi:pheromone receptor 2 [Botrytis cinerea]
MASNSSNFDPLTQSITILMADGITTVSFTPLDIDFFYYYNVACCINYGAQAGACLLMFFVVVVLTKAVKRKTLLFVLNVLSLIFGFLRAMLYAIYFLQGFNDFYAAFTFDFSRVPRSSYASSVAGSVIPLCMTITVNMSLYLQAYTVCKNLDDIKRIILTTLSAIVALLAIGFRNPCNGDNFDMVLLLIFTGKLVWTLYNRRRNGWRQWSAVRILAAMGGCTMVIPSIFAILEYVTPVSFPEAGSIALTSVALLLPISSLWAGMVTDEETSAIDVSNLTGSRTMLGSQSGNFSRKTHASDITAQSSHLDFSSRKGSNATMMRKGSNAMDQVTTIDCVVEDNQANRGLRDSTEMDLEAMGVRVNKSYGVQKA